MFFMYAFSPAQLMMHNDGEVPGGGGPAATIEIEDSGYSDENTTDTTNEVSGITVGATSNNLLVAVVMWDNDNEESITSVVWDAAGNNESFTEIATGYENNDDAAVHMFYLINPTAAADKIVTTTWDGDLPFGSSVMVFLLSGVAQADPVRDYDGGNATLADTLTASLTGLNSGDFIVAGSAIEGNKTADWTGSSFSTTESSEENDAYGSYSTAYGLSTGSTASAVVLWSGAVNHIAIMAAGFKPS